MRCNTDKGEGKKVAEDAGKIPLVRADDAPAHP